MDNDKRFIVGFSILALSCFFAIGFAMGFATGGHDADTRWQREAVRQGAADWVTDENGEPMWLWKSPIKDEPHDSYRSRRGLVGVVVFTYHLSSSGCSEK